MGMYTELAIGVAFKKGTPPNVISTIDAMTKGEGTEGPGRAEWMLRSGGSYYFDAQPSLVWKEDSIDHEWKLTVWTNIKNYEGEWEWFLDFIAPHLESDGYIGHMRYEEDYHPTLLYATDGRIKKRRVPFLTEGTGE